MLYLNNMGARALKKYIADKKVYLFGAGRALKGCLDIYFSDSNNIEGIIDNKRKLWGNEIEHNGKKIEIISLETFEKRIDVYGYKNTILFINLLNYSAEIVEQLDEIEVLDGLECFVQVLVRNTVEDIPKYSFSENMMRIPKKIHYIWFGGKTIPNSFKKNIDTWKHNNPDYQIIEWNETNYDYKKCNYAREAYEAKAWGFASNYARLDILYENGGIYLDTDVEALTSFDVLLNDGAFFNIKSEGMLDMGCGIGAEPKHKVIEEIKNVFESIHFTDGNGMAANMPFSGFVRPILANRGFSLENVYERIDGIAVYPSEVMTPLTIEGMPDYFSKKTISIHHEARSWKDESEKKAYNRLGELIKRIYG